MARNTTFCRIFFVTCLQILHIVIQSCYTKSQQFKNNKMTNNNKIPESLEEAYKDHLKPEKIRSIRVMCSLGLILYLAFIVVDIFALPSKLYEAILIRGFVIAGFVLAYLSTYHAFFFRWYKYIQAIPFLLAALGINLMIYLAEPTDMASYLYFAGLILVIMALFSWSHLKIINLVVNTMVIVTIYVSIEVTNHHLDFSSVAVLLPNIFFLIGAAMIGFTTLVLRNQYFRKNFLLQQSLLKAYEIKTKEADIQHHLANHDPLTDLPNRRFAKARMEKYLRRVEQLNMALVIMYIDLNGFKKINDFYGHQVGDEILKIAAKRLKTCVRTGDCLARLGGDEFAVGLVIEKSELSLVEAIRLKIRKTIEKPISLDGEKITVTASIGIASYPANGDQLDVLMDIADKRMYQDKIKNRNQIMLKDEKPDNTTFDMVLTSG